MQIVIVLIAMIEILAMAPLANDALGLGINNILLSVILYDSRFDQTATGNASLTEQEQRGFQLFMTEYEPHSLQYVANYFNCHCGMLFIGFQIYNNDLNIASGHGRFGRLSENTFRAQILYF